MFYFIDLKGFELLQTVEFYPGKTFFFLFSDTRSKFKFFNDLSKKKDSH